MAALFAIFVSQSNDFALGFPILEAVYSKTHPEYLRYIYLIAPISLCILNPIAFFMMEVNEVLAAENQRKSQITADSNSKQSDDDDDDDYEDDDYAAETDNNQHNNSSTLQNDVTSSGDLDQIRSIEHSNATTMTIDFSRLIEAERLSSAANNSNRQSLSTCKLLKKTAWATISNPIVFMTMIGLVSSFVLKRQIPRLIDPILLALSNTFSAIALFYLGFTMVGKIRNLKFSSIVIIMVLIFTKSIIYPLITRELVLHLNQNSASSSGQSLNQTTLEDIESMSTFGFLYGTFPTAPSLFFYITRFKAIGDDLISSALVFGTLASAPLMMISGNYRYVINSILETFRVCLSR